MATSDEENAARRPVVVINPNSSESVTGMIERTIAALAGGSLARFRYVTVADAPATISTDEDVANAAGRVREIALKLDDPAAVIIGCFSDPGLAETRSRMRCPVIGVQTASIMTALSIADRFGIIALSEKPIPRHRRKLAEMGVLEKLAKEVGLSGVSAHDAGHKAEIYPELLEAGRSIVSAGAGAVILGCAGFGSRRQALERDLGVPVIDPVMAAASIALSLVAPSGRTGSR